MSSDEITALISLLEDPDETIFDQVKDKIISLGDKCLPFLNGFAEDHATNDLIQSRTEKLIHLIKSVGIETRIKDWMRENQDDLLEGVLIVAKYQYPDLDEDEIRHEFTKLRQDIWLELSESLTAFEKVNIINHILFDIHGFAGNKNNFHSPKNSFINAVLESKSGNPLSLSIVYMILAQSLDIPVYGVNLPNHFILAYKDELDIIEELEELEELKEEMNNTEDVLFYINPFGNGAILHKTQIDNFLRHLNLNPEAKYYKPCENRDIIKRLFTNLVYAYQKLGYTDKADEVIKIANVLKS